jgi:single-strand DNA-binding protein
MQKINLLGNLGKDPEERTTPSGVKLITFSLAVTVKKDQTVWYECNIWPKRYPMFEGLLSFLKKGSRVLIAADFHIPELYQDKQGNTKFKLRVEPFMIHPAGMPKEENPTHQVAKQSNYEINQKDIGF